MFFVHGVGGVLLAQEISEILQLLSGDPWLVTGNGVAGPSRAARRQHRRRY
jgi:hypothetical protein